MEVTGERTIDQTPDRLWDTILDPDTLEQTIPGAQSLEQDGDVYEGTLERGLAGISIELSATVEVTDEDRPDWIDCDIEGTDNTINSRVDGQAHVEFEEADDGATTLVYETDFDFSGKLASLGSRIIKRKVNKDLDTFFSNLEEHVEEQEAAA
ncbi:MULTISPECIES: CoxG family protein [Halorussus]|uniref:CoxG family protein n=1 Tax=Halorussus TaxID=1070314 RepID=UPI0020A1703E|nr:SRPBCC domain-containing protein [Halorussus vallis]